jgi:indole-3-glycerol phosphate synthase
MADILQEIVAAKRREILSRREQTPQDVLEKRLASAPPVRDFTAALLAGPGVGVIAEVKKASPSAGVLREDFDPVGIARGYAAAGANAISVLTDEPYFQGKLEYLTAIRHAVAPPVLRKDFLIDPYQVFEARAAGADAVLLIAEILDDEALRSLLRTTRDLGMQALVELYERANLQRVLDSGATLIGVNNRDLRTFETRLEHTLELAPLVPPDCVLVSESGIKTAADVARLQTAGVKAILVGETLMRSRDVGAALHDLRSFP